MGWGGEEGGGALEKHHQKMEPVSDPQKTEQQYVTMNKHHQIQSMDVRKSPGALESIFNVWLHDPLSGNRTHYLLNRFYQICRAIPLDHADRSQSDSRTSAAYEWAWLAYHCHGFSHNLFLLFCLKRLLLVLCDSSATALSELFYLFPNT